MQKSNYITISATELENISPNMVFKEVKPVVRQLYLRANNPDTAAIFGGKRIAIVGSRKVSPYGRAITEQLARELAGAGITIVSGLALGVDSIAHRAALDTKQANGTNGNTIAVLPCGIETIYPRSHVELARTIYQQTGSALVSEYAGTATPQKFQFLERNRIIAALADAVIITEAAERSGSLSTANHALELGIPVMAVPGPITSATSVGANNLLKSGAHVVTCSDDVLSLIGVTAEKQPNLFSYIPETELEAEIIKLLQTGHTSTNEIIAQTSATTQQVSQTLTMLEIKGIIKSPDYTSWSIL